MTPWIACGTVLFLMPIVLCYWRYGSIDDEAFTRFMAGLSLLDHLRLVNVVRLGGAMALFGFLSLFLR